MVAAGIVVMSAAACSSPHATASKSPKMIRLHGWIVWSDSMPPWDALAHPTKRVPYPRVPLEPYSSAAAQPICAHDYSSGNTKSTQVVIRASNGNLLAGVNLDSGTLQSGQNSKEQTATGDLASQFICAVGWHSPPLAAQVAYQVTFGGASKVVNRADANNAIYLSPTTQ